MTFTHKTEHRLYFQFCKNYIVAFIVCTAITKMFDGFNFILFYPEAMKGLVHFSSKWFLNWRKHWLLVVKT